MEIQENRLSGTAEKVIFPPFPCYCPPFLSPRVRRSFALLFLFPALQLPGPAPSAHAAYSSEIKFQESLRAYQKGDYKTAMLGFMDVVIEEPENALGRDYLERSGQRVLEMENKAVQLRRKDLLDGAITMKRRLHLLEKEKEARIRNWDMLFSSVTLLAGDIDSFLEAVPVYERFLRETPVYFELKDRFSERVKIVNGAFYKAVKKKYPDIVGLRPDIDQSDLATAFITRDALSYRHVNLGRTEKILSGSARIKSLRHVLSALFNDEARAMWLYSKGDYGEAETLFRKVLKTWGPTEEAAFYSGLAAGRAAAANGLERPALLTAATPAAAPRPGTEPTRKTRGAAARPPRTAASGTAAPAGTPPPPMPAGAERRAPEPAAAPDDGEAILEADRLYEKGVREFSLGNYSAAAKNWNKCLRLRPEHSKARLGLKRLGAAGE